MHTLENAKPSSQYLLFSNRGDRSTKHTRGVKRIPLKFLSRSGGYSPSIRQERDWAVCVEIDLKRKTPQTYF